MCSLLYVSYTPTKLLKRIDSHKYTHWFFIKMKKQFSGAWGKTKVWCLWPIKTQWALLGFRLLLTRRTKGRVANVPATHAPCPTYRKGVTTKQKVPPSLLCSKWITRSSAKTQINTGQAFAYVINFTRLPWQSCSPTQKSRRSWVLNGLPWAKLFHTCSSLIERKHILVWLQMVQMTSLNSTECIYFSYHFWSVSFDVINLSCE